MILFMLVKRRAKFSAEYLVVQAEINYLGQLRHPNLVKLIGYCLEDDHRLLVYEFMPKGSMENHLFRSKLVIYTHRPHLFN